MQPQEQEFHRVSRVKMKQAARVPQPLLGPEMIEFFKRSIQKRQAKFSKVGECWSRLIPEIYCKHTSLESFTKGTLTVLVDSAPHLYELKQLLLAGLQQQILILCRGAGLRKITLKRGQWYEGDGAHKKIRF